MYCSAFQAIGHSGTTTIRKMSVNAESTSVSAISLGVRWRIAPSTRAIMRSRNDSPAAAVIRTTMRSESTMVPPVTPERSPPASRITGADSPVIADSSTEAMPSMISPSPGMIWPASTTTRSPGFSRIEEISSMLSLAPQTIRRCVAPRTAQRFGLRLAARLGQRGGEVGEQHGQEQPDVEGDEVGDRHLAGRAAEQRLHDEQQGQHGPDLDHEHHRVLPLDVRAAA